MVTVPASKKCQSPSFDRPAKSNIHFERSDSIDTTFDELMTGRNIQHLKLYDNTDSIIVHYYTKRYSNTICPPARKDTAV